MINIVIPMAGRGSRFADAGYTVPKPLIDVLGKPMIERVSDNVRPKEEHRFLYLCLQEHIEKYDLVRRLEAISPGCVVISVDHVTEGAACTVLLAEEYIDNEEPMMIANSDQIVDYPIDTYLEAGKDKDGLIMTVKADGANFSYLLHDEAGRVTLVREKEKISDEATVGIYNFTRGSDYVRFAKKMIEEEMRIKGEYYVAPVYNLLIEAGRHIGYHNVGTFEETMHGLGTPEELNAYLNR